MLTIPRGETENTTESTGVLENTKPLSLSLSVSYAQTRLSNSALSAALFQQVGLKTNDVLGLLLCSGHCFS